MAVPMDMNVPKVPPPWTITLPTVCISSPPLRPILRAPTPPKIAPENNEHYCAMKKTGCSSPEHMPTVIPIMKPSFILSKQEGWPPPKLPWGTGIIIYCLVFWKVDKLLNKITIYTMFWNHTCVCVCVFHCSINVCCVSCQSGLDWSEAENTSVKYLLRHSATASIFGLYML